MSDILTEHYSSSRNRDCVTDFRCPKCGKIQRAKIMCFEGWCEDCEEEMEEFDLGAEELSVLDEYRITEMVQTAAMFARTVCDVWGWSDEKFIAALRSELKAARAKHPPIRLLHEGAGIIGEEYHEYEHSLPGPPVYRKEG